MNYLTDMQVLPEEARLANQRGVSDQSEAGRCDSFSDGDGDRDSDGRVGQEENNYAPFPTKIQILRIIIKIMSYKSLPQGV